MRIFWFLVCLIFALPVAADVTVSWTPPTENIDGTPVDDLAGYIITYTPFGSTVEAAGKTLDIEDGEATEATIPGIAKGTHWFLIQPYDTAKNLGPYGRQVWSAPDSSPGAVIQIIVNNNVNGGS